jgi:hypothetical protein
MKAPSKAGNYYPIFVSLLSHLVKTQEELVDLHQAEKGLPARYGRGTRLRPALEFHGISGVPGSSGTEDDDEGEDKDSEDGDDNDDNSDDDGDNDSDDNSDDDE